MTPDQIPQSVTQLVYTAPAINTDAGTLGLSQNSAADLIAHFWPAIEAHIRGQIADHLQQHNPDRDADFSAGVDWATDTVRYGAP